ncbi:MAG: hypothetical protein CVV44_20610 [Spirochaetae bacterium HGW-Spirochaetae-1]|jgi:serine phosphatase RsbU (regulator of sigma subunit)|nr:MAG: hypothetical protein CVV44_20610 [Spirochaetae bacterium HGW-Spirochaetae-1]
MKNKIALFIFFIAAVFWAGILVTGMGKSAMQNDSRFVLAEKGTVSLEGFWRVTAADSPRYADPDSDDSHWDTIAVPGNLMELFPRHSGIAWYRTILRFPSKNNLPMYSIILGKICDTDEVYFNGTLIGKTGNINDETSHAFDRMRIYHIPTNLINTAGDNILAVRTRGYLKDSAGMIWGYFLAGDTRSILKRIESEYILETIFIAFYLLIALVFLLFSQTTSPLYYQQRAFALFSLCIAVYLVCVGQIKYIYTDTFLFFHILQYIAGIGATVSFIVLLRKLFQQNLTLPDKGIIAVLAASALSFLFIREINGFTIPRILWQSSLLYIIFIIIENTVRTVLEKRWDYIPVLAGMGILLPGALLEVLRAYTLVPDFDYFKTALPGLVILISYFLSDQLSIMRHMKAQLIERLELKVAERTRLLQERNEAIESELEIARNIQTRLLPSSFPDIHGLSIDSLCIPMDRIGGDFYTYCENEDTIRFLIADVAGHGLSSAFLALIVKNAFDNAENPGCSENELLGAINKTVFQYAMPSHFITAFVITIDKQTRQCRFSNAGHHPALLFRKSINGCIELYVKGTSMGWRTDINFSVESFQLLTGDRLVLYTDGIVECMNPAGELFGSGRLESFIGATALRTPSDTVSSLIDELRVFSRCDSFDDDISCVVVDVL